MSESGARYSVLPGIFVVVGEVFVDRVLVLIFGVKLAAHDHISEEFFARVDLAVAVEIKETVPSVVCHKLTLHSSVAGNSLSDLPLYFYYITIFSFLQIIRSTLFVPLFQKKKPAGGSFSAGSFIKFLEGPVAPFQRSHLSCLFCALQTKYWHLWSEQIKD